MSMKCESCHNYSYFLWYTDRGVKKVHSCIICEQCNKDGCEYYREHKEGELK